jgi:hypothetical protein
MNWIRFFNLAWLPIVAIGLGACSAAPAGSAMSDAPPGAVAHSPSRLQILTAVHVPIALGQRSPASVAVEPGSACQLQSASSASTSVHGLPVPAVDGVAHFDLGPVDKAIPSGVMSLVCRGPSGDKVYPLSFEPGPKPEKAPARLPIAPELAASRLALANEELVKQGLPPRPDAKTFPGLARHWPDMIARGATRTSASPQSVGMARRGMSGIADGSGISDSNRHFTNWAGYEIHNGQRQVYAEATIEVPHLASSFDWAFQDYPWGLPCYVLNPVSWGNSGPYGGPSAHEVDYAAVVWVGLDGTDESQGDLLQAGTESDWYGSEYCDGTTPNPQFYQAFGNWSWWEWFPADQQGLPGLTFAGDFVWVSVYPSDGGGNFNPFGGYASYWVCNDGPVVNPPWCTFTVGQAPSGSTFQGTSAEWILERPGFWNTDLFGITKSTGTNPLAHFLPASTGFFEPYAVAPFGPGVEDPTGPGAEVITMSENGDVKATAGTGSYAHGFGFGQITFDWVHP